MKDRGTIFRALDIELPETYTPLYRDFVSGAFEGREPCFSLYRRPESWAGLAERRLSSALATPALWEELTDFNRRAGASDAALGKIGAMAKGECVAVVGGQQPGLLGGPALVLYKAATCVALAERFEESTGVPCAPIFMVSGDDADFAEIRTCTVYDGSLRRLVLSFPAEIHRPGRMVGSLPCEKEAEAARALLSSLGAVPGGEFVGELLRSVGDGAADHGGFVAGILSKLLSGEGLVVLDGRSREMRKAGAATFEAYLARRNELSEAVAGGGREMKRLGYHAQLEGPGLEWWLFTMEGDLRVKLEEGGEAAARRALHDSPDTLSPNVALRPILRDSVLPTVFCMCGPSEIAYSLQLGKAYEIFQVPPPGLFPRLAMTMVPDEGEEVAGGWTVKAVSGLLGDVDGALRSHYLGLAPDGAVDAVEKTRSELNDSMSGLSETLGDLSGELGKAADSAARACGRSLEKLEDDIIDFVRRSEQGRNPRLKGLSGFLRPERELQERILSALYPFLSEGPGFVDELMSLARRHVSDCETGKVRHYCYRMGAGSPEE